MQNTYNGIGIEFNFKAGTCRMADWRKGKIMQWQGKRIKLNGITAENALEAFRETKTITKMFKTLKIDTDYGEQILKDPLEYQK